MSFIRCRITGNKGAAVSGPADYSALEWRDCVVGGNANNDLPPAKAFADPAPKVSLEVRLGKSANASEFIVSSANPITAALWDFADGPPFFQSAAAAREFSQPHAFSKAGKYLVTLVCWDDSGRAARVEAEARLGN